MVITPLPLKKGQWFPTRASKTAIVGHYTSGPSVDSAFQDWNNTQVQVATPFIIDVHGSVFQTFPAEEWAYHTGAGESYDKRAVGIELVNAGPLTPGKDGKLYTWWNKTTPYDGPVRTDKAGWRQNNHWAMFPDAQIQAFAELVATLMERFKIPQNFIDPREFLSPANKKFLTFQGFVPHSVLSAVRSDLGPAFPYDDFLARTRALQ